MADGERVYMWRSKERQAIQKVDDWYALGRLIFRIHWIDSLDRNDNDTVVAIFRAMTTWSDDLTRENDIETHVKKLKDLLLSDAIVVEVSHGFNTVLNDGATTSRNKQRTHDLTA